MENAMPHAREARGERRTRRVNAPVRRRQRAGSVPDVLFCLAFIGWTMAVVFVAGSFAGGRIAEGDAGPVLARLFGASLAVAALVVFALGLLMYGGEGQLGLRLAYAGAIGMIAGVFEALLFIELAGVLLVVPALAPLLTVRPIREWFLMGTGLMPRGDGIG